jgi:LmbE family N-acetylglucosaminyl deacetylase
MTIRLIRKSCSTAVLALCWSVCAAAAGPLPLGEIPAGKTFLVIQPHHDDHTWQYGFGGLIAKMIDAGWHGTYVRVSNDEKDGPHGWGRNDLVNEAETLEATKNLGIERVISLNWRNDHMDSIPLNELRAQLILLIRELRPDAVMAYHPWGHYDRNPDHRVVARAAGEAVWLAGYANAYPEHFKLGLRPHRVPYRYYSQRSDYGKGYQPNIAIELNASQVARKAKSYWLHRNVRLNPETARGIRQALDERNLKIPELEGLGDEEATQKLQEWSMEWISAKRGSENGVKYAEVFSFMDEWRHLPGLREYLRQNAVEK